jgi:regulator of sigma E protease
VIDSVLADKPAAMAGLRGGDSIVAVGGVPVRHWGDVIQHVSGKTSGSLAIDVIRNGERQQIVVSPEPTEVPDPATGEPRTVGRIGAAPREPRMERLGVGGVIGSAAGLTWDRGTEVIRVVGGLLTGKVSVSNLGGPIAIARTSVEAARSGVQTVLLLLAFLSINIAVLNMLPIPVLDGGQILINLLEAAKGSAFSVRTREYILRFGLLAIGLLFVTVMWNDLSRLVRELLG